MITTIVKPRRNCGYTTKLILNLVTDGVTAKIKCECKNCGFFFERIITPDDLREAAIILWNKNN